jgi:hypothetical protein
MERQLKKQKTEYVEIPLKPKPMLPLMTTHQLERNDSVTTKDLQKMYNTLVPSSQPDPPRYIYANSALRLSKKSLVIRHHHHRTVKIN